MCETQGFLVSIRTLEKSIYLEHEDNPASLNNRAC